MEERLGRQLVVTAKGLHAAFDHRLAKVGGSLSTWVVLQHALDQGELSQRLLAKRMSIEGPTLVRHLDRLEDEGLVKRRRDHADRRVVRVGVTAAGRRVYQRLRRVADEMEDEMRALLGERDHDALHDSLRRLHEWIATQHTEDAGEHQAG
jgi:MarR family transcriptional regulator for hemolysin